MTWNQIYDTALASLSPEERFQLATKLLGTVAPQGIVDYSEAWSEQDVQEYAAHCREKAAR